MHIKTAVPIVIVQKKAAAMCLLLELSMIFLKSRIKRGMSILALDIFPPQASSIEFSEGLREMTDIHIPDCISGSSGCEASTYVHQFNRHPIQPINQSFRI